MRFQHVSVLASVAILAAGCESNSPSVIAGTYVATSFVATETGEAPMDILAEGGSLTIAIAADNTTTGSLTVPGIVTGGADVTFSMEGTALRHGDVVQFVQSADTFVRDMSWTLVGDDLQGLFTNSAVTIAITLTRQ